MPFFLVSHTSLVESDNDLNAARKALARIKSGPQTTFTVKFDESTVVKVSIPHDDEAEHHPDNCQLRLQPAANSVSNTAEKRPLRSERRLLSLGLVLVGCFVSGLLLGLEWQHIVEFSNVLLR